MDHLTRTSSPAAAAVAFLATVAALLLTGCSTPTVNRDSAATSSSSALGWTVPVDTTSSRAGTATPSGGSATSRSQRPATGPARSTPAHTAARNPVPAPASASAAAAVDPARAPLTAAPPPPRTRPRAADYASPAAAAAAWLAVHCYQPVTRPANFNIAAEAPLMTAAGWAFDRQQAISDRQWAATVRPG